MKNIKKFIYGSFLLLIGGTVFPQSDSFTVSGKIEGLDTDKMFIRIPDKTAKGGVRRDSILVKDDSFHYTGPIKETSFFSLWPGVERTVKRVEGGGYYPVKSSQLQFIASPGASIRFSGEITDFVDAYPSGDEANNTLAELNRKIYPLMNKGANLMLKIANREVTDSVKIDSLNLVIQRLDEKVVEIKKQFIAQKPSSVAAIWLLSDMMLRSQISNEEALELFGKMDREKLNAVPFYEEVQKRTQAISATAIGEEVPEIISSNTYDGDRFDLSSLKGKYVVLDFWGTWCGPCISGMPRLKELQDKYPDRLEIVGIAQESDDGTKWRKFLESNPGYQWHQVLNVEEEEDFILKFNVAGFPTKIIVDPQGKIVGRYVGEDDAIYTALKKILE